MCKVCVLCLCDFLKGNLKTIIKLKVYLPALEKVVSSLTTQDIRLDLLMTYGIANALSQMSSDYLSYILQSTFIFRRDQPLRRTQIKELKQQECAEIS